MGSSDRLADRIRQRILARLHAGELQPGAELTSIRSLAREMDRDHRTVAEAYRKLEEEGLVDIRARSGVYVAGREHLGEGVVLSPTASWVVDVIMAGLSRGIPVSHLPDLVDQCTRSLELRCACVEAVEDSLWDLKDTVDGDLGLEPVPVLIPEEELGEEGREELRKKLEGVDVVITSVDLAPVVKEGLGGRAVPVVEFRLDPEAGERVFRELDQGPVTLLAVDGRTEGRLRDTLADGNAGDLPLRVVTVEELEADADALSGDGTIMVTGAAREKLDGVEHPDLFPYVPALSRETTRELVEIVVRRNAELDACP